MRVAIQGELGSFSHQAALEIVPGAVVAPCALSVDVFESLEKRRADAAVIPIENSLAGSVTEHFDLLLERDCHIEREYLLPIVHNLIARKGTKIHAIRRVLSHPVALAQCRKFLNGNRQIVAEPFYDTAGAVKHVVQNRLTDCGAIAGAMAAVEHGGQILRRGIEDNKRNFTRFLLIRPGPVVRKARGNKTSIAFAVKNKPGTLFSALRCFAEESISLSKIESRPVPGRPWEYVFYVDLLTGSTPAAARAFRALAKQTESIKVLGIYPKDHCASGR